MSIRWQMSGDGGREGDMSPATHGELFVGEPRPACKIVPRGDTWRASVMGILTGITYASPAEAVSAVDGIDAVRRSEEWPGVARASGSIPTTGR